MASLVEEEIWVCLGKFNMGREGVREVGDGVLKGDSFLSLALFSYTF